MAARPIRADGFVDPCIPTRAAKPPVGPDWVHEIKHDGYRLIVRRDGKVVQLLPVAATTGPVERGTSVGDSCGKNRPQVVCRQAVTTPREERRGRVRLTL
jgi:hypothetical protein